MTGAGAEMQKPLAILVIGGLVSATLLVLPALYAPFGSRVTLPALAAVSGARVLAAHQAAAHPQV